MIGYKKDASLCCAGNREQQESCRAAASPQVESDSLRTQLGFDCTASPNEQLQQVVVPILEETLLELHAEAEAQEASKQPESRQLQQAQDRCPVGSQKQNSYMYAASPKRA